MKKGKSTYTLQIRCDSNSIEQLMQSFLSAKGFTFIEKKGEQYYRAGDQMIGFRGLSYSILGQTITISAWIDGMLSDYSLEQNSLNMMAANFRNDLNTLFQEIEKLNGDNTMNNNVNQNNNSNMINSYNNYNNSSNINQNGQSMNTNNQPNNHQFIQSFNNEHQKKKETMCEIGFWLSILGLLGSFAGIMMGLFVYIMNFYFASQGLKTRKRGKAITTIILSIISIIIILVQVAIAANL